MIALRRLERLDKDEFSEEERAEAEEIAEQRREAEAKQQVCTHLLSPGSNSSLSRHRNGSKFPVIGIW